MNCLFPALIGAAADKSEQRSAGSRCFSVEPQINLSVIHKLLLLHFILQLKHKDSQKMLTRV